jgi:predicted ATPase
MRIAISGSHRTGKSTLVAELAVLMPTYTAVDEPYHLMEEDGHEFSQPPSIDDFEAQLERSIDEMGEAGGEVLFDRCPLDLLAYIAVHDDAESFDFQDWLPKVRDAVDTLDLVVFVPIEEHDRIVFSTSDDDARMRAAVDEKLRELLVDDPYEFGVQVVEVGGDLESRARAVLRALRRGSR